MLRKLVFGGFAILFVWAGAALSDELTIGPTPVPITPDLALNLRGAGSYASVEAMLRGPGTRIGTSRESDGPHEVRAWRDSAGGTARAYVYDSGDFSIVLRPAGEAQDIVLNSFGAFVCPTCSPPVNACGRRPWWVPHDVHFDNFDCGCTLAGPQSLGVGRC
ncbi:hypothetical protein NK718_02845 [Alsobacter sp. SYSU M60028]|uniref:Uncharacterized protein n=1 Tax=Alsobacter ponti TaxID=2962936 RepID=A0ABT1L7I2_9HYPH|nr:hypothetical protein [Alsobacter ponti]MCP8937440.1 hypothetical protein [Alsobacter ponti]